MKEGEQLLLANWAQAKADDQPSCLYETINRDMPLVTYLSDQSAHWSEGGCKKKRTGWC